MVSFLGVVACCSGVVLIAGSSMSSAVVFDFLPLLFLSVAGFCCSSGPVVYAASWRAPILITVLGLGSVRVSS